MQMYTLCPAFYAILIHKKKAHVACPCAALLNNCIARHRHKAQSHSHSRRYSHKRLRNSSSSNSNKSRHRHRHRNSSDKPSVAPLLRCSVAPR
jgi:hypothetical protein